MLDFRLERALELGQNLLNHRFRSACASRDQDGLVRGEPVQIHVFRPVHQKGRHVLPRRQLAEALTVRTGRASHDQHRIGLVGQLADRLLAVLRREADAAHLRLHDLRETPRQNAHDPLGFRDGKRRLRQIRHWFVREKLERLGLLDRAKDVRRFGRFLDDPDDLIMPGMTDQNDLEPGLSQTRGLRVDPSDERAGGVNDLEPLSGATFPHVGGDSVGREHQVRAVRHVLHGIDEMNAPILKFLHDPGIMHDLVKDVKRRAVPLDGLVQRRDRPIHPRAKAPRRSQKDFHG